MVLCFSGRIFELIDMRYKQITPKFLYYVGIFISAVLCAISLVIFEMADVKKTDGYSLLVICSVVGAIGLYSLYERTSKYIYASVDTTNKAFIFGNIFFHQEVDFKQVRIIKKRFLKRRTYEILIGKNVYYVYVPSGEDLRFFFE